MSTGFEVWPLEDVGDGRGRAWLAPAVLDRLDSVADMHLMTLDPGHARGHHFHREKREVFVVEHEAAWRLLWDEGEGKKARERRFDGCGAVAVFVPPGCAHAIENDGPETIRLVALTDRPYDPANPDAYERRLLP